MLLKGTARYFLRVILYGVPPLIVVGLALFVREMNARPDLDAWHTATLDGDFRAEDSARIPGLAAYRRLEDELFRQLESEVYDQAGGPPSRFNRFHRGSLGRNNGPQYCTDFRIRHLPDSLYSSVII